MKTKKKFTIERVREFCKLINEGATPSIALKNMGACQGYSVPLKEAGLCWKEKNGTYKAVERIHADRYLLFTEKKSEYNIRKINKKFVKQPTLFCVSKQKQTTGLKTTTKATTIKVENPKLSFFQRIVKSLFKL
jgi:hypothetical protein